MSNQSLVSSAVSAQGLGATRRVQHIISLTDSSGGHTQRGLAAELNSIFLSTVVIWTKMMLRFETILNTYSTDSAPQQIANMTLTVVTIRVIRFRTLSTP